MISRLIASTGHGIAFQYDKYGRIGAATDDAGNIRKYSYDATGHLASVADALRVLYRFSYKPLHDGPEGYDPWVMTRIMDGDNKPLAEISYQYGRVVATKLADGSLYNYDYNWSAGGELRSADVTFPDKHRQRLNF